MRAISGGNHFVTLTPYQEVIHKTRYAKWNEAAKRRETFDETITRYFDYFGDYLKKNYNYTVPAEQRAELWAGVRNLGVQPSMRALMTAGTALDSAQMAAYNCTYLPIDAIESFSEMMYILMTGSGVGFSVERFNTGKLPPIKPYDPARGNIHVIVDDSREGWCDAYKEILYAIYAGCSVTWDVSLVRPKGSRLKTFGGYSSGPEPLVELFRHTTDIFAAALAAGQQRLKPKQVFSLCTMIAQIVVVGGVRRSATICLFDKDDVEMLNAKGADSQMYTVENGVWKPGPNAHFAMANISAVFEETPSEEEFTHFWSTLRDGGFGEPGIFNRAAVRAEMEKIGRPNHYEDGTPIRWGVNPCCVAAGTLVDTTRGQIPIERVTSGDDVLIDGVAHKVLATLCTGVKDCVDIHCADGTVVTVTPDHRVLTVDGYKRADALTDDDKIITSRLPVVKLENVDAAGDVNFYNVGWTRVKNVMPAGQHTVYDLDVPTARAFVANGLVVHNCEIILRPYQACNLSSAVIRSNDTYETLLKKVEQATILGTWQAAVTQFQYLRPVWRENIEAEALLGVCLSGFYDHPVLGHDSIECDMWLRLMQEHVWTVNAAHADAIGINRATSVTAVKPSGNSGELADSASGIHPRHAKHYIRRVRQSGTDPMSVFLEAAGVPCEVSLQNERDRVFSFPIAAPEGAVTIADITAVQQLDHWLHVKRAWATHTVSCTINVKEGEWSAVEDWVRTNFDAITGLSFFPASNGYKQAPFEEITLDEYTALVQNGTTSIDWSLLKHFESQDGTATGQEFTCIGGACTL